MGQHEGFVQKLRAILLVRTGHAPMSINQCRKRAGAGRDNQVGGNNAAVGTDGCGAIANRTGIGNVKESYAISDLESLLLDVERGALVVVPVMTELVKGFLRQSRRKKQKQDASEGFHADLRDVNLSYLGASAK